MHTDRHLELFNSASLMAALSAVLDFILCLLAFLLLEYRTGFPERITHEYTRQLDECCYQVKQHLN
jgi:hypothetical protein